MILQEIKEPRIGQIRKDERGFLKIIVAVGTGYCLADVYQYNTGIYKRTFDVEIKYSNDTIQNLEIYGQLGITHRKDGNGLYEIPRENEFEADDVVRTHYDNEPTDLRVINYVYEIFEEEKFGILGMNYEFINNKLEKINDR